MDLLDELSGVAFVGAPDVQAAFRLDYGAAALVLFVAPQLLGLLLETPAYLLADRLPRKGLVVGGLLGLGVCQIVAGLAPGLPWFAAAWALCGPLSGIGVNLAQATLIDSAPAERERLMTRWTFMGHLGDLVTPLLFAVLAEASLGWRDAFVVTGGLVAGYAVLLALVPFPDGRGGEPPAPAESRVPLSAALASGRLWLWLFAVSLCGLLDEVLVAFAALYLESSFAADVASRSQALACFVLGSLLGLLLGERLLGRVAPLRLLRWSGGAGTLVSLAWLAAPDLFWSGLLLGLLGICVAPLYPIAQAQAYASLPGRSGLVNAAAQALQPLELALPFALGWIADRFGLRAALALLALQPLGLLLISLRARPPSRGAGARRRAL